MNDKEFTDELFKRMYDLGYKFAEVSYCNIYFWKDKKRKIRTFHTSNQDRVYLF